MGAGASIVIKAVDRFSSIFKNISSSALRPFNKDVDELRSKLDAVNKHQGALIHKQAELRINLLKAKKELKDSTAEWKKLGDAASQSKLEKANLHVEELKSQLKDFQQEARNTRIEAGRLQDSLNQVGSGSQTGFQSLATGLAASGILKELGSAATDAAGALSTSVFGGQKGNIISGVVGGAASGAASGAFLGAPGMIAGAAIGGASGLISGKTQNFQAHEEVFKGYVQELYENTKESVESGIATGSKIAGGREQTQVAFAQRFKSEEEATKYLARVKQMAAQTNYEYDEITGYSKKLLNSYDPESVFGILKTLSDASAGLNLQSADVDMFISGLSRMRTTGKATQEYLNYFSDRGVDVSEALSRSTGLGKESIPDALRKGDISGEIAAQAILDYIGQEFGGLSAKLESSFDAMKANLEDTKANIDEEYGIGYNETRKKGMQSELDAYGGELGDALSGLHNKIGSSQAYFDNLNEQMKQEALSALVLGKQTTLYRKEEADELKSMHAKFVQLNSEYETADESRKAIISEELKGMEQQALTMATATFDNNDVVSERNRIELDGIKATNALISRIDKGVEFRLKWDEAFSFGSFKLDSKVESTPFSQASLNGILPNPNKGSSGAIHSNSLRPTAWGAARVPYDDFPALLHEGERVLTAAAAREADRANVGGSVTVKISGNQFTVRDDDDIERIATALVEKIKLARMGGVYRNV